MAEWVWTDSWELGHEYECTACGRHIDVRGKADLPDECPHCGARMNKEG